MFTFRFHPYEAMLQDTQRWGQVSLFTFAKLYRSEHRHLLTLAQEPLSTEFFPINGVLGQAYSIVVKHLNDLPFFKNDQTQPSLLSQAQKSFTADTHLALNKLTLAILLGLPLTEQLQEAEPDHFLDERHAQLMILHVQALASVLPLPDTHLVKLLPDEVYQDFLPFVLERAFERYGTAQPPYSPKLLKLYAKIPQLQLTV